MSASNYNYVCFSCRYTIRHPKTSSVLPRCPSCGEECYNLGYKVTIPKRESLKEWSAIEKESRQRDMKYKKDLGAKIVRRIHFIENEILRLSGFEGNRDHRRTIKGLKGELEDLKSSID